MGSLVLGIDLTAIKPMRGVRTLVGDITTPAARAAIKKEAGERAMDVVLHDGAPNIGGAWASEAYSQNWLALEALRLATDVLAPRGTFVTKVFRRVRAPRQEGACTQPARPPTNTDQRSPLSLTPTPRLPAFPP